MAARVDGLKKATEALSASGPRIRRAVKAALRSEAEAILTEAKILVPYLTGNLHDSHRLTVFERPAIFATIEFLAPYALRVHEEPRPPSSNGTFKYLEIPLKEASSGFAERVATRARALLGNR